MGSNMAENHPVGFQWVMEAKLRGTPVIHVDPRFTRTSANATMHVPIRAGSDVAFLGGLVNYILEHDRWFHEYVVAYTNAATVVSDDFRDTEDLEGLFSGWDPARGTYDESSWQYRGVGSAGPALRTGTVARSDYHLGRIIREKLAGSAEPRDRAILDLSWDYPTEGELAEPSADAVLREVSGWNADGRALGGFAELKDDGSTSSGCWIYCGAYADGENQPARRRPGPEQTWVAPEWGWAWPANRRLLYNRASADPSGRPWSERKKFVWWDEHAGRWVGADVPDFNATKPPGYEPPPDAQADAALPGDAPFIMQGDGRGWLYAPSGLVDGPLPPHYEPHESPFDNALYRQRANPARVTYDVPLNPYNTDRERYPYVTTTVRLTEHHTTGAMSRTVGVLSELQPEFFCEVSPRLARERDLEQGGWAAIITARGAIRARVLITERMKAIRVEGRYVEQVGLPYHWGYRGLTRGDAANDAFAIVLDPNVHIQEVKAATCDVRRVDGPVR